MLMTILFYEFGCIRCDSVCDHKWHLRHSVATYWRYINFVTFYFCVCRRSSKITGFYSRQTDGRLKSHNWWIAWGYSGDYSIKHSHFHPYFPLATVFVSYAVLSIFNEISAGWKSISIIWMLNMDFQHVFMHKLMNNSSTATSFFISSNSMTVVYALPTCCQYAWSHNSSVHLHSTDC